MNSRWRLGQKRIFKGDIKGENISKQKRNGTFGHLCMLMGCPVGQMMLLKRVSTCTHPQTLTLLFFLWEKFHFNKEILGVVFFLMFIYLFILAVLRLWLHAGFALVAASRVCSSWLFTDFSLWWSLFLWSIGSIIVARGLSCLKAYGLPGPGIKPMSVALAGGFLTVGPSRKFPTLSSKPNY